jgi:hypothetical protein
MSRRLGLLGTAALLFFALAGQASGEASVRHLINVIEPFAFTVSDACHGESVAFEGIRHVRGLLIINDQIEGVSINSIHSAGTGVGLTSGAKYILTQHMLDLQREQVEREPGRTEQQTQHLVSTLRFRRIGADGRDEGDFYFHEHLTIVVTGTGEMVVDVDSRTTDCR